MNIEIYLLLVLLAIAALYFAVPPVIGAYMKYRGKRLITCPETKEAAAVDIDVKHAAFTALRGDSELRLKDCTRWPERQECGQECLLQIEAGPEDCLVRGMLVKWYEGKNCAFCDKPFEEIHLLDNKPAFLTPEGKIANWSDVPPETLRKVFVTHKPVCWDCSVAEAFREEYPELVVERPWKGDAHFG